MPTVSATEIFDWIAENSDSFTTTEMRFIEAFTSNVFNRVLLSRWSEKTELERVVAIKAIVLFTGTVYDLNDTFEDSDEDSEEESYDSDEEDSDTEIDSEYTDIVMDVMDDYYSDSNNYQY